MKKSVILIAVILLALVLVGLVAAMFMTDNVPKVFNPNAGIEEVTMVVTEDDIAALDEYPDLNSADLTGSTCYEAIEDYKNSHPEVDVTYKVYICNQELDPDETKLVLEAGSFDLTDLLENLKYLPGMKTIELPKTDLSMAEIESISAKYSNVEVSYTVDLLGQEVVPVLAEFDLSDMTSEDVEPLLAALEKLPNLTSIDLIGENELSTLPVEDAKRLMEAAPQVQFQYSFDFYGNVLSTATERVELKNLQIGNEGEQTIRDALDMMPNCTYFKLEDCGIDSEVMASIRDSYPDVKVVWRIYCGKFTMCTDETMVRMTFSLDDKNSKELMYCTDVTYMDIGHDESLTDVSFVKYMPNLECVIISGAPVKDISAFADHDKLTWMEMVFCGLVEDISCLETCDNLKYLNISFTRVSDLTPVENLPLERLNAMGTRISLADAREYEKNHPDCISVFEGEQPYGYGWRYNDHGYTFFDYYANMRVVFRYDEKGYSGNRRE